MAAGTASPLGVTYYPSCLVNLRVKFDEAYTTDKDIPTYSPNTVPNGIADLPPQGAMVINSSINAQGSHVIGRVPLKASVELQGVRKPGKFTLTFDYRVLPLDPRLIRSTAVEIYMDSVQADNFAAGVVGPTVPNKDRSSQITAAQRLSALRPSVDNLVLQGLVDSWRVEHSASGSIAILEGRDMTGLFLNTPITPDMVAKLNLAQPITKVVEDIAYHLNGWLGKINVATVPASFWPNGEIPSLANLAELDVSVPRVRRSAKTGKILRRSPGSRTDKLNFWDLITRYCGFVGAVPYFTVQPDANAPPASAIYKPAIMIAPQQNLYDNLGFSDRSLDLPSPFRGGVDRVDDNANPFKIRRLMFGRNIEDLNIERKFMGITARAVKAVCYDSGSKNRGKARLLEAISSDRKTYAEAQGVVIAKDSEASARSGVSPNGEIGAKDVMTIQVNGVKTQAQLQQIADGLYNEIMRGETGGSVKTRSLSSFGAGNEDPDLIRIRPMDSIALMVDSRLLAERAPSVSPLNDEWKKGASEWTADLIRQGFDPNFADAIVGTTRNNLLEYQSTYRVNAVKFDWDVKSGISLAMDFHNYVIPRNSIFPTKPVASAQQVAANTRGVAPVPTKGGP